MSARNLLTLAAPGVAALLPPTLWLLRPPAALPEPAFGWAALVLAGLLAWRFARSRIAAAAAGLALLHGLLPFAPPAGAGVALGLLAPLFALLALTADRRIGAPLGLLQVALGPVAAGAAALVVVRRPAEVAAWLQWTPLKGLVAEAPQGTVICAALGLAGLAGLALRRGRALEAGLLWAALAGSAAAAAAGPARAVWILGAGLALVVAAVESAYALAYRDELTDLPGRRALSGLLAGLRPPYAIAVVDVDHFKRFNDRHGHDVGDQVLRMVAARLAAVGGGGRAFRSGGEEFTLVFPGCSREEALPHLEEVRRAVAATPFVPRRALRPREGKGVARRGKGLPRRGLRVTISVGAADGGERGTPDQVVRSADKAMYRAKQGGRNRVVA